MYDKEKQLGDWVVNLIIDDFRAVGNLLVTEEAIYFIPSTIIKGSIDRVENMFKLEESDSYLIRLKSNDILLATAKSKLLNKRISLKVTDKNSNEQEVIVDYGAMSIKAIVEAISKITKVEGKK